MRQIVKRAACVLVVAILCVQMLPLVSYAQTEVPIVGISALSYSAANGDAKEQDGGLFWGDELASVAYDVDVPKAGEYNLQFVYKPLASNSDFIQLDAKITQGSYEENFSAMMDRPVSFGDVRTEENGNQVRALPQLVNEAVSCLVREHNQVTNDELVLNLQAGVMSLELIGVRTQLVLMEIRLVPATKLQSYAQIAAGYEANGYMAATQPITVQAENIYRASSASLTAQFDRSDALVQPTSPGNMLLNIAGGQNFSTDGQWMEWLVDVPESGLYELRIKARQNFKNGLSVNRRVTIDGQVPYSEALNMVFGYDTQWNLFTLQTSDGMPAPAYLEKGEHILRLEVVPGPQAESIVAMQDIVSQLTDIYQGIVMITGVNPDINREYFLERDIPDLLPNLAAACDALNEQAMHLKQNELQDNGEITAISTLVNQMQSFVDEPGTIHARLANFKGNIDSLASFTMSISDQPLDIDYISFAVPGSDAERVNAGFFAQLAFEAQALFASFFYEEAHYGSDALRVWANVGSDQLQALKDMTDNGFTAQTGIQVEFSLVQQGVNEAILADEGPDVMLFADNAEIVNLAMRGALAPLDAYEGLGVLRDQCQEQSFVPYTYKGAIYGVPLTQVFPMMFVRTDIFEDLGLEPPKTWEELYGIIPVIQRSNMQVGIPSGELTYGTMLLQQGQGFYNDELTATNLLTPKAVETFRQYTRLFSDYGLPIAYDFYNRFRSGEMPLAIADYSEYNRLLVAANEISGRWQMMPVPVTETDSGVNASVMATAGSGAYILSMSNKQDDAFEFLQWFADAAQQAEYGKKSEALLGVLGRYMPANQEALAGLPWLASEQDIIMNQWQYVQELPQLPGSYYTRRNLANAFRAVFYDGENYREALDRYAAEIDRELERKRREYP